MKKKILVFGIVSMFLLTSAVPFAIAAMNTKVNVGNIREQISPLNDPPSERWSKTFGGDDSDEGYDIQITTDGGYIVVGSISPYEAEWDDVWLIKLDKYGNILWDKTYGTDDHGEGGYSVQQTNDDGYIITGSSHDGMWLIKTDPNGNIEWDKTFENTYSGYCVRQTSDGGYIITGYGRGVESIDAYLIKTDSQGNLEWKKTFGGDFGDWGKCVSQTNDGGYIMTGTADYEFDPFTSDLWLLKTDSNGNKEWEKKFGGDGYNEGYYLQQTDDDDGGYIIIGKKGAASLSPVVWLIKTNSNGDIIWDRTYRSGILAVEWGNCVQQTSDGGYIITGNMFYPATTYYEDVLLIKTDQFGYLQWRKTYDRGGNDGGNSVRQTDDGGYIIVGETDGTASGYRDIWVIKTDSEGNTQSKAVTHSLSLRILEKLLDQFPILARLLNLL